MMLIRLFIMLHATALADVEDCKNECIRNVIERFTLVELAFAWCHAVLSS